LIALRTPLRRLGSIPMAWLFLVVAGLCEIAWPIGLKYTEGFTRLLPTIGTVLAMAASIGFLGLALKSLPVGTAYAVWRLVALPPYSSKGAAPC
jgi:multidrug transporter EmrE-like cation transporter